MATYTINSDSFLVKIDAESFDQAAAKLAESTPGLQGVKDLQSLLGKIESIDGAWLWIEDESYQRHYAGQQNM